MRILSALLAVSVGLSAPALAQTCTGLCQQQVTCPSGQTTSITGKVYAPNGTDPLPNVLVYIPNAAVDAFTPGVSCPVVGQAPSGSPLVGSTTAVDGSFTLTNVPVGSNIPLVIVSGRWRRQLTIPATTACADTAFSASMPKNKTEGDIPKFAINTGAADQVECVLRKVGIDDAEFTSPSGTGRIHLYTGTGGAGAQASGTTPNGDALMGNAATLNSYDVLMLPCEGGQYSNLRSANELSNLVSFANAGGRVYSSHFSYSWMWTNPPFDRVVNWVGNSSPTYNSGTATVDTTFPEGQTLKDWLQLVGASTVPGQIDLFTIKHDFNGVNAPTQSWLTLNTAGNPVMQFVFDAPVGATTGQCGRVLFNEYHVENPASTPTGKTFPAECPSAPMTPQEKLLEYSLFELTNDGGEPTLTPASADFGSFPVGFTTAPQTFVWKNNSVFPSAVSSATTTGDFSVVANSCSSVVAGGTCNISVVFKPTALGARAGLLTVASTGKTITASLTGTGTPGLSLTPLALDFGSVDVGASTSRTLALSNLAPGAVPMPPIAVSGDFSATSNCPASIPAGSNCTITATFTPTVNGPRTGTLTMNSPYADLSASLKGNGLDFTVAMNPASGDVIAGYSTSTTVVTTPLSGFAAPVSFSCSTNAPGSTCTMALNSVTVAATTVTGVSITTTSTYTVIGYGGLGTGGVFLLFAFGSAWLLQRKRSSAGSLASTGMLLVVFTAGSFWITGCSGKQPAQNANPTQPGSYTYTVTATDGTIKHSATYSLKVNIK